MNYVENFDKNCAKDRVFCAQCGTEIEKGWVNTIKEEDFENEDDFWIAHWICSECFREYQSHL